MNALIEKIHEYKEYSAMISELQALTEAIADELKSYMTETNQERVIIGQYQISFKECIRKDVDRKRLENEYGEIYAELLKETTYKRFQVS